MSAASRMTSVKLSAEPLSDHLFRLYDNVEGDEFRHLVRRDCRIIVGEPSARQVEALMSPAAVLAFCADMRAQAKLYPEDRAYCARCRKAATEVERQASR